MGGRELAETCAGLVRVVLLRVLAGAAFGAMLAALLLPLTVRAQAFGPPDGVADPIHWGDFGEAELVSISTAYPVEVYFCTDGGCVMVTDAPSAPFEVELECWAAPCSVWVRELVTAPPPPASAPEEWQSAVVLAASAAERAASAAEGSRAALDVLIWAFIATLPFAGYFVGARDA